MSWYDSCERWIRQFLFGDYKGPPVDFVMALATVFAMIAVIIAG